MTKDSGVGGQFFRECRKRNGIPTQSLVLSA